MRREAAGPGTGPIAIGQPGSGRPATRRALLRLGGTLRGPAPRRVGDAAPLHLTPPLSGFAPAATVHPAFDAKRVSWMTGAVKG